MKATDRKKLIQQLQARFEQHRERHAELNWSDIQARLEASPKKLNALHEMERSGGEPDVIGLDTRTGSFVFVDCSAESPAGRRSLCYDQQALESRKQNKPAGSAMQLAKSWGITILTEDEYRTLQQLGEFDTKTSSWVLTPPDIRDQGGALFCDRRYGAVFLYHNGAESYYAARGFRGRLLV